MQEGSSSTERNPLNRLNLLKLHLVQDSQSLEIIRMSNLEEAKPKVQVIHPAVISFKAGAIVDCILGKPSEKQTASVKL